MLDRGVQLAAQVIRGRFIRSSALHLLACMRVGNGRGHHFITRPWTLSPRAAAADTVGLGRPSLQVLVLRAVYAGKGEVATRCCTGRLTDRSIGGEHHVGLVLVVIACSPSASTCYRSHLEELVMQSSPYVP